MLVYKTKKTLLDVNVYLMRAMIYAQQMQDS